MGMDDYIKTGSGKKSTPKNSHRQKNKYIRGKSYDPEEKITSRSGKTVTRGEADLSRYKDRIKGHDLKGGGTISSKGKKSVHSSDARNSHGHGRNFDKALAKKRTVSSMGKIHSGPYGVTGVIGTNAKKKKR